jgi:hypothetical protein
MTPDSSPLESKALPGESVAGQVPSRGSPIIVRSGRGDWCCIAAIANPGQPGASSRPLLAAAATRAGVTAPSNPAAPNRNLIAAVAVATAASASRHAQPKVSGILTSTPAVTATVRNNARIASSRCAARRNQPRTVAAGTPRLTPIRRCPSPFERAVNAAQIRSAAYALRSNTVTGNNTCVARQLRHRARRGRSESANPSIHRERA